MSTQDSLPAASPEGPDLTVQHLSFLATVGEVLASSLDLARTLQEIARLAVGVLGDLCIVDLVEGGQLKRVATAHVVPAKTTLLEQLRRVYPPSADSPQPAGRVLRTGQLELLEHVTPEVIAAHTRDDEHARLIRAIGMRSHLAVPLVARGSTVGVISLGITESSRTYGTQDVTLAQDLARRAALAIDNARLYELSQVELSERRQAEDALRLSESRFRAMFEQSPLSTQIIAADGRTIRVNRAWEMLWGFTLEEIGEYNILSDPQLDAKGIAPLLRRAFAGESVSLPAIRYDPNENVTSVGRDAVPARWVSAFAYPVKDATGALREVVLVHEDVTAARQREDELLASKERLRRALSIDTVGVLFFTLDGRITEANAAFESMTGYSSEELRNLEHWHVLTPSEFAGVTLRAADDLAVTGETAPFEKQMIRKDGTRWWGLFAPRRLAGSGRASECVEFVLDITEAKRAEEALLDLEERRRMALDAAELGTWTHDLRTGVVQLDRRTGLHYGIDDYVVPFASIAARIHPEDAAVLERAIARATDPQVRGPVAIEYRVLHPDGSTHWLAVNGQVRFEKAGGIERATVATGTTRDVTESRRAEQALRDAARHKDEFLAILAHELRNPLAPIRTAIAILRSEHLTEGVMRRAREIIDRQVTHMTRLIDDLLDVSRLSRGHIKLQLDCVALDDVLDDAIETARPLIEIRGHRLEVRRCATPVRLYADLTRLSQVFANLLDNAAKYTPPGGSIVMAATAGAEHVDVTVTDSGEGIAAEHLEAVFELFTRGAGHPASTGGGLGIGLALVRRLVDLHGGTVMVSSAGPQEGATFTVRLPMADSARSAAAAHAPDVGRLAPLHRRVLIVDDNADAADSLSMLLQSSGCSVRTAYGGEAALQEVEQFRPEIVLLDLGMPAMDGFDVCRQLRALPLGMRTVVVALTGWGHDDDRRRTELAGFDAHLVKPVDVDVLLQVLRQAQPRAQA